MYVSQIIRKAEYTMSKDSLAAIGNTSFLTGLGAGSWDFITQNNSALTVIFVALTFFVTAIAHYYDKKIKKQRAEIENQRAETEIKKLEFETEKLRQENLLRAKVLELQYGKEAVAKAGEIT
jgi:preprotein translocase subunit SecG